MGRYEQKIKERNNKREITKKKFMIFFMVFIFFSGIMTVDAEYSNMVGYDREMVLGCIRLNSEMIRVYFLGKSLDINNQKLINSIQDTSQTTLNKTRILIYKIRRKIELKLNMDGFDPKGTQPI
ncbi:MAG: hypothetical protein GX625_08265 [Clostridiaceae bacterium]|nr:hypothetical protein [Clostridiaceae bacterium]